MELTNRQRELAQVALGIVAAEGMSAVTFRSVAAASGWSLGAIQKAFSSKDQMYAAMFTTLRSSGGAGPASPPGVPDVHTWLTQLILSTLPLDEARRSLVLQGQAFADRAAYDPTIGDVIAAGDEELRQLLAMLIQKGQSEGEIPPEVDPPLAAWTLLALAQGVASQLLYDRTQEEAITARVTAAVDTVLHSPLP